KVGDAATIAIIADHARSIVRWKDFAVFGRVRTAEHHPAHFGQTDYRNVMGALSLVAVARPPDDVPLGHGTGIAVGNNRPDRISSGILCDISGDRTRRNQRMLYATGVAARADAERQSGDASCLGTDCLPGTADP